MKFECDLCFMRRRKNKERLFLSCFSCLKEFQVHTYCYHMKQGDFFFKRKEIVNYSYWNLRKEPIFPKINLCSCCMKKQASSWNWWKFKSQMILTMCLQSEIMLTIAIGLIFSGLIIYESISFFDSIQQPFQLIHFQLLFGMVTFFIHQFWNPFSVIDVLFIYIVCIFYTSLWLGWDITKMHFVTLASVYIQYVHGYIFYFGPKEKLSISILKWNKMKIKRCHLKYQSSIQNQDQCYICWSDEVPLIIPCLCKNMPVHESCLKMEIEIQLEMRYAAKANQREMIQNNMMEENNIIKEETRYDELSCLRCQFIYQWSNEQKRIFDYIRKLIPDVFLIIQCFYLMLHLIMILQGKCSLLFTLLLLFCDYSISSKNYQYQDEFNIFRPIQLKFAQWKYDYLTIAECYRI